MNRRVWSRPSEADVPNSPTWLAICWETAVRAMTTMTTKTSTDAPAAG